MTRDEAKEIALQDFYEALDDIALDHGRGTESWMTELAPMFAQMADEYRETTHLNEDEDADDGD